MSDFGLILTARYWAPPPRLQASLSSHFLLTLPDLVTPWTGTTQSSMLLSTKTAPTLLLALFLGLSFSSAGVRNSLGVFFCSMLFQMLHELLARKQLVLTHGLSLLMKHQCFLETNVRRTISKHKHLGCPLWIWNYSGMIPAILCDQCWLIITVSN